jgi:hypothetical protein
VHNEFPLKGRDFEGALFSLFFGELSPVFVRFSMLLVVSMQLLELPYFFILFALHQ